MGVLVGIISILLIIFLFRVYKIVYGKTRIMNITFFFCAWYIVKAYLGSVLFVIFTFEYEKNLGMYKRPDLIFKVWAFVAVSFVLILLGVLIANISLDPNHRLKHLSEEMCLKPIRYSSINRIYTISAIWFFFLFGIIIFFIYRSKIGGKVPLEYVFSGKSALDLARLRSDTTNNFSGKLYRYELFMKEIPIILCLLTFFLRNKKKSWKILFFTLLCYNVFFSLTRFEKAPLFMFVIVLFVAYIFETSSFSFKLATILFSVFSLVIVILYIFFMGQNDKNSLDIFKGAMGRLFLGQTRPFFWYLKYVEDYGLLYGLSMPNPSGFLPFKHVMLSVEIMNYAMGELGGVVGSMPTVFIAEIYANFGILGLVIGSLFFGLLIGSLDLFFINKLSKDKNVFWATIYVFCVNYFSGFAGTSILGILFDVRFFVPMFIIFLLFFISNTKSFVLSR